MAEAVPKGVAPESVLDGFNAASIDYYDIKVRNVINSLGAQQEADLCAAGDPICTPRVHDLRWSSHLQPSYITSGLVDHAASFVAGKL